MLKFIINAILLNLLIAEENFVSFEIVTYDNPYHLIDNSPKDTMTGLISGCINVIINYFI